jgi:hypothetical protein
MEDQDLTYRVLAKGFAALHIPEARVIHHGFRDWQSGSGLIRRTYVAMGATYMKYLRLRDLMGSLLLMQAVAEAVCNILSNLARRRRPFGFGRLGGLFVGLWRSFELDVDRHRLVYVRNA